MRSKSSVFSFLLSIACIIGHGQSFSLEQYEEGLLIYPDLADYGFGVSFCDFNQDGWDDLSFGSHNAVPKFFLNDNGHFTEIELITDTFALAKSVIWVDLENDKDLDLFITNYAGESRLYENIGDLSLVDITENSGIDLDSSYQSTGSAWGDYNNDGYLDLYITNYSQFNNLDSYNRLYKNNGDGTFEDVTVASGTEDALRPGFQGVWIDLNNDQLLDLHVSNDRVNYQNTLFINNGDGTFSDSSSAYGLEIYIDAMTNSWGDMDNDGDFDAYFTNSGGGNAFMLNEDGLFSNQIDLYGIDIPYLTWSAMWVDFDNDMYLDLHVSTSFMPSADESNYCFINNNGTGFQEDNNIMPFNTESQYATAIGDYNNDGLYDLVGTTDLSDYATLYKNEATNNAHFLSIELEGVISNYHGIGTKIELTSGGTTQTKFTFCGANYLSQDSNKYIFGLHQNTSIDSIKLFWPSGHMDVFYDIDADQSILLVEGSSLNINIESLGDIDFCEGDSLDLLYTGDLENFIWNTGDTTNLITVFESGSYYVNATSDQDFTFQSEVIEVFTHSEPEALLEINHINCFSDSTGSIIISSGGTVIDSIIWADNSNEFWLENLNAGTYFYEIWDNYGCYAEDSVQLVQNEPISAIITTSDVSCYGDCDGSINIEIQGGVEPYLIYYDNQGEEVFCSGTYNIQITDSLDCISEHQVIIESPEPLELDLDYSEVNESSLASAQVSISGGTPPYNLQWSNGSDTDSISDMEVGDYWIEVFDSNGCFQDEYFQIVTSIEELPLNPVILFPNPTEGMVYISGQRFGPNPKISIYDITGKCVFQEIYKTNIIDLYSLDSGSYLFVLETDMEFYSVTILKL